MSFKSERILLDAIEQCQLNKIIYLVKHGHNIHIQNTMKQNFLIHILQQQQQQQQQDSLLSKKRFQIFQFLISQYNLNIHSFDNNGKNLFNWATNLNCTQEALYLLNSYPGDINILVRDQSGSCSLHYAVEYGNEILVHAIVNYLLRYRLRFDIKDGYNYTPEDLARNLGYHKISYFLAQASRSTVFMSRELIPFQQQLPIINKTTILSDSLDHFYLIETRINTAKRLGNWKTVLTLRNTNKNRNNEKTSNKIFDSIPQTNPPILSINSLPKLPRINPTSLPEQMLHLIEPQLSSSFRRSFINISPRLINLNTNFQRSSNTRQISQASSRRLSKRDSEASQSSIPNLQDVQNRFSIPPMYKQYRQTVITTN